MKRILPIFLSLLLLGGCTFSSNDCSGLQDETPLFQDHLDLSQLSAETLAATVDYPDVSDADEVLAAEIAETMGDAMTLYVYITALPVQEMDLETMDAVNQLPEKVYLSENGNPLTCPSQTTSCEVNEEGMLILRCYFHFDREVFRGQEITLHTENWLGSNLAFTWSPENEGTIRYADLKDQDGTMAGTFNLNTFGLNITLWGSPYESNGDLRKALVLLDENGEEIDFSTFSRGGSQSTLQLSFSAPMEPDTVKTVQVGPYTAELG